METLYKNGQASKDAVKDAEINLQIAILNLTLAEIKLAAAATKSAAGAESLWTGFYGDIRMTIGATKINSQSSLISNVASNINSIGNVTIYSGLDLLDHDEALIAGLLGNITVEGSNIYSDISDINITSKNNTIVQASQNRFDASSKSESWQSSLTLASSAAGGSATILDNIINSLQASLSLNKSRSNSDTQSVTYNHSNITALNGEININSLGVHDVSTSMNFGGNTTLSGVNIHAYDIRLNTQGNLLIESLQNSYAQKSKSSSMNIGFGTSSVNLGFNNSRNSEDKLWTDNQTSLIGSNSVNINTTNNTEVNGALVANIINATQTADKSEWIDGANLVLNSASLTYHNLQDYHYGKSSSIGFTTAIGAALESSNGDNVNPNQTLNFFPSGSTYFSKTNNSFQREQITKATIGQGNIIIGAALSFDSAGNIIASTGGTLNNATILSALNRDITNSQTIIKDQITGALDIETTIDNRLFVAAYEALTNQKGKIMNDPNLTDKEKEQKIKALQTNILLNEQQDLDKNLQTSTKELVKIADTPLTKLASSDITGLNYTAQFLASKDGSIFTLASQMFGLGKLLDSNDLKLAFVTENTSDIITEAMKQNAQRMSNSEDPWAIKLNQDDHTLNFDYIDDSGQKINVTTQFDMEIKELNELRLMDYLKTRDLSNHGINNVVEEGYRNGRMQLGNLQNQINSNGDVEGRFVVSSATTHGVILDIIENQGNTLVDFFGKGLGFIPYVGDDLKGWVNNNLKSANIIASNEFEETRAILSTYENVTITPSQEQDLNNFNIYYYNQKPRENMNANNPESEVIIISNPLVNLRTANHSNGGDRNEYALGELEQVVSGYYDKKGKYIPIEHGIYSTPVYDSSAVNGYRLVANAAVQYYGTPTNTNRLGETATNSGVWMDYEQQKNEKPNYDSGHFINYNDPIPNVLGVNSNSGKQWLYSLVSFAILGSQSSPHSNYYCMGSFCGYDGFNNDIKLLPEQKKDQSQ